jgi:two-component system cell cycle sensor histidine kinase/response regulator CckA
MAHSILIVEDDDSVRRLLVRILESHGFVVIHTGKAAEALSLVRGASSPIDLAIIDMVMPGTSGLDFAAEMERHFPSIQLLYMSGYVDSIAVDVIQRRSPQTLLLKPFTEEELLTQVHRLLGVPHYPPHASTSG